MNSTSAGNSAENAVADYLRSLGYKVLEQNWKTKYAEIDIVASKSEYVYFVEVKYRRNNYAGDGFDYITGQKLHHMQRAAEGWVLENNWQGPYQLMAAAVIGSPDSYQIDLREIS